LAICRGIIMADAGLVLLGLGAWDALKEETRILVSGCGVLSLLSGFLMIGMDTIRLSEKWDRPALTADGDYLGIACFARTTQKGRTREKIGLNAGSNHDEIDAKRAYEFWNFRFRVADAE
jgi:hypothetical protein